MRIPFFLFALMLIFLFQGCDETVVVIPECDTPASECVFEDVLYTSIPNLSLDFWLPYGDDFYQPGPGSFWITPNEASQFFDGGPAVIPVEGEEAYGDEGFAAKLISRATQDPITAEIPVVAGYLISGRYTADLTYPLNALQAGRPFRRKIATVSGYYKYLPQGNDEMAFNVYVRACTQLTDECGEIYTVLDTIGTASLISGQTVDRYTRFSLTVEYTSTDSPDDVILFFRSSADYRSGGGVPGSTLYLDALEVTYF